ncbi:hypothetical protein DFJ58DRAFT_848188 [Suillus subalutaceus]|uniref:uncharacterized protein n=1 Tax=Suillus subalutaceus TaxID=48586 RepID=UPI001B877AD4|nr:uncharacterized protein DFJ58DRAFT_848188 [Suillus subalutaceus]KAG1831653.1 hypothetical protein DFJ58DRAFT_848188 [Suillus subalutaceus]
MPSSSRPDAFISWLSSLFRSHPHTNEEIQLTQRSSYPPIVEVAAVRDKQTLVVARGPQFEKAKRAYEQQTQSHRQAQASSSHNQPADASTSTTPSAPVPGYMQCANKQTCCLAWLEQYIPIFNRQSPAHEPALCNTTALIVGDDELNISHFLLLDIIFATIYTMIFTKPPLIVLAPLQPRSMSTIPVVPGTSSLVCVRVHWVNGRYGRVAGYAEGNRTVQESGRSNVWQLLRVAPAILKALELAAEWKAAPAMTSYMFILRVEEDLKESWK